MKTDHWPRHSKNDLKQYNSGENYKALVENSIQAYFLTSPDGTILASNHAATIMFGYSQKELFTLNKRDLLDNTDEKLMLALKDHATPGYISLQATGIRKNGEHFPIELSSVIFYEANGDTRTSIMVYDTSGRKTNEPDFRPVIESITDGFFTLDNNWIITYWNDSIEKISGLKTEDTIGKSFLNFFNPEKNEKIYTGCRQAKEGNSTVQIDEFYESAKLWLRVSAYPSETGLTVFCKNITEQKTAEAAIKLSNERYDLVSKATNDLVWDWDIITGEIYRNCNGVQRVYGHHSNDSIKTNQLWAAHIHPEDRKRIDEQIAHFISSEAETSFAFEYRFRREDGLYNYISDKGYIIRNNLGIVTRMIGAARDITEQKQTARNIEESEQRYKMFVQQSTEGIWRIELDEAKPVDTPVDEMISYCMSNAYLAECNDAFAKMYGFSSAQEAIGIPLNKLMPADNPLNLGYLYKFFTNNFKVKDEISYERDQNGEEIILVNNMVGIIENGYIKRAWGTQRNITEQKKAEQSLQVSEEQYRNLFNNNPSCIFIWDIETLQIIEVNRSAVELYGYSRKEFLELTVLDIRTEDQHAKFLEMVEIARQYDVYKKTYTWKHLTRKGQTIFMEIASHNITYNGRRAVLAIGNNVTEKIQLENSLNEERKMRQKQITDAVITGQERERRELGEELHDNINQILASTRLYIECALADELPRKDLLDKGRVLLDSAMKEIRKLSRTLLPPSLGEVSLLTALKELTDDIEIADPICIDRNWKDFDETGLSQKLKLTIFRIIQEQLNNIHKHARAKNININLAKHDQQISLTIQDDGVGFDTMSKRSGVGLRNISSRAEVNNGIVTIESAPGTGCKLAVVFNMEE